VPIVNAIEELQKRFKPEAAKNVSATYLIAVNGQGGGSWLTKIADGTCQITPQSESPHTQPDCKISINSEDLEMIISGRMSAMTAALSGMLSIDGELGLAMQLVPIFF
jgi:putative sterol carrier protein